MIIDVATKGQSWTGQKVSAFVYFILYYHTVMNSDTKKQRHVVMDEVVRKSPLSQDLNKVRESTIRICRRKAFVTKETINKMTLTWQKCQAWETATRCIKTNKQKDFYYITEGCYKD